MSTKIADLEMNALSRRDFVRLGVIGGAAAALPAGTAEPATSADAIASLLFVASPAQIGYLKITGEMGVGVFDPARSNIILENV